MEPQTRPTPLTYGRYTSRRRRNVIIGIIGILAVCAGTWAAWPDVRRMLNEYQEDKAAQALYTAAETHVDPAGTLIYSERAGDFRPEDAQQWYPTNRGAHVSYSYRGDPELSRGWIIDRKTHKASRGPHQTMLYLHKHTSANGVSAVATVDFRGVEDEGLSFFVQLTDRTKGELQSLYHDFCSIPMRTSPGEVRFFAGQPDPSDPSRFTIPCEIGQTRWNIDGQISPVAAQGMQKASWQVTLQLTHTDVQRAALRSATPKPILHAFAQAMYDNDAAVAQTYAVSGPGQTEVIRSMTMMVSSMRAATEAAYQRYGDEVRQLAGGELDMAHIDPKSIDAANESIDGDTAVVSLSPTAIHLVRSDGIWKVDLVKSFAGGDPQVAWVLVRMFVSAAKAADQARIDIEAGQYADARSAMKALLANMKKAIEDQRDRMLNQRTSE